MTALSGPARDRADRLLEIEAIDGRTDPPPSLEPWLRATFGSVEAVRRQRIVRVTNLATRESVVFATLRGRRPLEGPDASDGLRAEIAATEGDPFCDPVRETPADTFGRVRGRRMLSGANAGLADAHHAVLVFDRHDPLAIDADLVADLFATAREWADRARQTDPAATHYLPLWNCLWRAGGSIIHGHAQVLLGRRRPHAAIDRFLHHAREYRARNGTGLAADLVELHLDLGLGSRGRDGVATLAHLVPVKEREILVVGPPGMDERAPAFTTAVADVLGAYLNRLGVRSFNLALWREPLGVADPDLPPIVRIVDRGDPHRRPSDIGAMELYGSPIVSSDPFEVARALSRH